MPRSHGGRTARRRIIHHHLRFIPILSGAVLSDDAQPVRALVLVQSVPFPGKGSVQVTGPLHAVHKVIYLGNGCAGLKRDIYDRPHCVALGGHSQGNVRGHVRHLA